ncbi:hypothetical protein SAMN05216357_11236 [Porphyromonadaceae bacterium KH3CP3RA]|nr:hypothetical protein SAMN05216357_11236 [Porphyromonadaceae bacterium KH3CP3RA]
MFHNNNFLWLINKEFIISIEITNFLSLFNSCLALWSEERDISPLLCQDQNTLSAE